MRTSKERPQSYHQSAHNDSSDQYYLSQPIDDYDGQSKFERNKYYATVRQPRSDSYHNSTRNDFNTTNNDFHILASQISTGMLINNQQPRSRAPISYNPTLYQDNSYDTQRYKPHLHAAKALTRQAMREKSKQATQCLKESSV